MKIPRIIAATFIALTIGAVLGPSNASGDTVENKAKDTVIPKLELREATPSDALMAITAATGIKVFYTPAGTEQGIITVSLTNISASEAFKYITECANLKFSYQENGVYISTK